MTTNIDTDTFTVKTELPDDPKALAEIARKAHAAVCNAAHNIVREAITAGRALLKLKERVRHGEWTNYLPRHCGYDDRTARVYMQLARHADLFEGNWQRAAVLSLRGALKLIGKASKSDKSAKSAKASPALSFLAFLNATVQDQRRFVDAIGLIAWLAAMPPAWFPELERRIDGQRAAKSANWRIDTTISKALRQALSLQQTATNKDASAGVAAALNGILNKLRAAGFDLNDVDVVIQASAAKRAA
jgi:hypothetical protein